MNNNQNRGQQGHVTGVKNNAGLKKALIWGATALAGGTAAFFGVRYLVKKHREKKNQKPAEEGAK